MSTDAAHRINPDSPAFLAAGRLLVALAILLLVGTGLRAGTDVTPVSEPENRQSAEADQLRTILGSLSQAVRGNESPQLTMAWEDLRSDLESVSRDLERARVSIDVVGLVNRVESFRETFASLPDANVKSDEWDRLARLLNGLHSPGDS